MGIIILVNTSLAPATNISSLQQHVKFFLTDYVHPLKLKFVVPEITNCFNCPLHLIFKNALFCLYTLSQLYPSISEHPVV